MKKLLLLAAVLSAAIIYSQVSSIPAASGGSGSGITSLASQTGSTQTISRGVGIGGSSAADAHSFTIDLAELVNNQILFDGSQASRTLTFSLSGSTDPVVTVSDASFDVSTGTLKQGGTAVVLQSRSVATTSPLGGGGDLSGDLTLTCTTCVTAAGTLTSNLPLIGGGGKATSVGTRSGNTTEFGTVTGTKTTGKQLEFDADGNIKASTTDIGGSGSGATAISGLTDLKATKTSTVLTVATGRSRVNDSNGIGVSTSHGAATITINDAPAGDTGTVRVAVSYNSGSPVLKCYYGTGITFDASYTVDSGFTGSTCTSGNAFLIDDVPVASVTITAGAWDTVTDLRAIISKDVYNGSSTITRNGNAFSLGTFTLKTKIALPLVGCSGTSGTLLWDTLASLSPTATCSAGSTNSDMMRGTGDWPDSDGDYSVQVALPMPDDWDVSADLDAIIKWRTSATSGNAVFQIQTACRADDEVDDVAWNTASTVTDAAKGTTNQLNDAAITNITKTGCAAGEILHVRLLRNRTHASDTLAAVLSIAHVELTARRSITQ